jgi:3-deoxy-7-phosphoheptulonate synthase
MPQRATDAVPGWLFELFGRERPASDIVLVAGPCSVSRLDQTVRVAQVVAAAGATAYRGGAFKPRSRPDAFQGAGADGLEMLRAAKAATGLPIVTELLDIRDLEAVLAVADIIQVGARNMHNTPLLKELGRTGCPVLLKRGMSATIDETVGAAEYVLCGGNPWVILCERGIRTFETAYRFTLDLMAVPMLQERLGLPVIVDPSHAPGRRELVTRLSKAAIAIGADGIIVEVDENPDDALSDGPQQLSSAEFSAYATEIHRAASTEGRQVARAA